MFMKLVTGQEYDHCTVEYVLMMMIDEGRTDAQILAEFAEESKKEVKERLVAFRKECNHYEKTRNN